MKGEGLTRLDAAVSFTDGLAVSAGTIDAAVAAITNTGTPRTLSTYFDKLGREVTKYDKYSRPDFSNAAFGYDSLTGQSGQWTGATYYAYDVWGGVTSRSSLIDRATNRSAVTYYGYDLSGGLIRQVDPEGFVTDHSRRQAGPGWPSWPSPAYTWQHGELDVYLYPAIAAGVRAPPTAV